VVGHPQAIHMGEKSLIHRSACHITFQAMDQISPVKSRYMSLSAS